MTSTTRPVPRATYRLQLNKDFTFAQVEAIAPYLGRLGVSHAYLSPILMARPGSTHGYDVTDQTRINPELGTLDDFRRMAEALKQEGVGIILDIVPNHMGIGGDTNPYWLDVLEWGEQSRFAGWFDIDWAPAEPSLHGKVLVPFLGSSYGDCLREGRLELRFDQVNGSFAVWAEGTHKLPVVPSTYGDILVGADPAWTELAVAFAELERDGTQAATLKQKLAAADTARIEAMLARFNGSDGRDALDALIQKQHWRPARFSVGADDINYRRFFIVSDLAAIRIEREDVFEHVHRLVFQLVDEGLVEGLRIDHIDGLYDPKAYCLELRRKCPRPIYLIVEKILGPGEPLRADWDVDGTTGYEFGAAVTQLLSDPVGEVPLTRTYIDYTGRTGTLAEEERTARLDIVDYEMTAELDALTARLRRLALADRSTTDLTRNALRNALRHLVTSLPVYRTYVDADPLARSDDAYITEAITAARKSAPAVDGAVFDFVAAVMTGRLDTAPRDVVLEAARRIQQYTGPVMAKGLEDTVLYRFNRLIALSDVGARPDLFSKSVAAFHNENVARLATFPDCMLGTSTHDTKRGEDTRARIVALTGHADLWAETVPLWRGMLDEAGAPAIDPNDSYYFFQLLLGAWPTDLVASDTAVDREQLAGLRERMNAAMLKSVREARLRTNWNVPRSEYEQKLKDFVDIALATGSRNPFLDSFLAFQSKLEFEGACNGIIETVLKLTVPGVPDIYQGAELWEQSMVDPDNRRPVDYSRRQELAGAATAPDRDISALMGDWRSGAVKLATITRILGHRRDLPQLFSRGTYEPLPLTGPDRERVIAFVRRGAGQELLVMAALQPWRGKPDAQMDLPEALRGDWRDILRNARRKLDGGASISELTDAFPVAVLRRG